MSDEAAEQHCCSVTLIVTGKDLDPDEVTALLGMTPDQSWRYGEHRSFVRNDGSTRVFDSIHDESGWKCFMPSAQSNWSLQEQLASWLDRLSGFGDHIRRFNDRGWETELNCFVASSEFLQLSTSILSKLAGLGLDLTITFSPDRQTP